MKQKAYSETDLSFITLFVSRTWKKHRGMMAWLRTHLLVPLVSNQEAQFYDFTHYP